MAALILWLAVGLAGLAPAQTAPDPTPREQAAAATADLASAVAALEAATGARDRVEALTRTIRAYEAGLGAARAALREVRVREAAVALQFEAQRDRVAQLVGVLSAIEAEPEPLMLLHPSGALGTVRSGMMLAEVTPALAAEAAAIRADLTELRDLRDLQAAALATLHSGLSAAQDARTALGQAISDRTALPRRFTEDPQVLRGLLQSADTLDAFAAGLALEDAGGQTFADAKGRLPLPVLGSVLRRAGEADAAGIRRPGLLLATGPQALVTAPAAATIRYVGPLLDYGNVMILEPGGGYLLVLAGLDTVYGSVGDVIGPGAPVGLMGGNTTGTEFLQAAPDDGGVRDTETLYMELRLGPDPVNPDEWFAGTAPRE